MWEDYISVTNLAEAAEILEAKKDTARIVAGATDLILEMERGLRKGVSTLIDITRIPDLDQITLDENGIVHIGALVTHNHIVKSKIIREFALPLALASWEVGSPQIRNRGTVAGNLITASPANDTISPLMALDAQLTLLSSLGERTVALSDFYTGVRKTVLQENELLKEISFRAMSENEKGIFIKFALRRAQAISLVNCAMILSLNGGTIEKANITLGAVAPTIIHAFEAEQYLIGKKLEQDVIIESAKLAQKAAKPINDVRGSASYRKTMTKVIVKRGLTTLAENTAQSIMPAMPVLLWGNHDYEPSSLSTQVQHVDGEPIVTTIDGKKYTFTSGYDKTLLRLLREDANMIGTKEGCDEGECGACTVYLDGIAVMSCMVPAPRAHGAEIVTVEGLANFDQLHPVQEAFVKDGAVQCGYCTPGFLMSAAKLLEEKTTPSQDEIKQAITGNLCRCTGYYKILEAIENASKAR